MASDPPPAKAAEPAQEEIERTTDPPPTPPYAMCASDPTEDDVMARPSHIGSLIKDKK